MQQRSSPSVLVMELQLFCTDPAISFHRIVRATDTTWGEDWHLFIATKRYRLWWWRGWGAQISYHQSASPCGGPGELSCQNHTGICTALPGFWFIRESPHLFNLKQKCSPGFLCESDYMHSWNSSGWKRAIIHIWLETPCSKFFLMRK